MKVGGKLHASAAPIPIGYEPGWAPEPVRIIYVLFYKTFSFLMLHALLLR